MAITYAPHAASTKTYAGIIAIARAKLDEMPDESFLSTHPGVVGSDNTLYLDLVNYSPHAHSAHYPHPHLRGGGF